MVETPLETETAHGVERAGDGKDCWDGQSRTRMGFGIAGPYEGQKQAAEHQKGTAKQRFLAEVQEAGLVDANWKGGGDDLFSLVELGSTA